jgi:hypothetical protein
MATGILHQTQQSCTGEVLAHMLRVPGRCRNVQYVLAHDGMFC